MHIPLENNSLITIVIGFNWLNSLFFFPCVNWTEEENRYRLRKFLAIFNGLCGQVALQVNSCFID